jgi:FKBP-type peptidyl-prolyl cis-trans isomerase
MKRIIPILVAAALLVSCQSVPKNKADAGTPIAAKETPADASYAFGVLIGESLKTTNVAINYENFMNGMKDSLEGKGAKIDSEAANALVQSAITDARKLAGAANKGIEEKYLADNKAKPGVICTASGLQYSVVTEGTGAKPTESDMIKVDYVGSFTDGKVFDSSIDRGEPATFMLGQVIPGWIEGLQLMNVGSKYIFYIPSALAYGEEGAGEDIPPYTPLVFEVTLLSIEDPQDVEALEDPSGEAAN